MNLSKTINNLRKMQGLSQAELGKISGVKQATISQVESGKNNVRVSTLQKIAQGLGLEIEIKFNQIK
jgi:transcriptional regulator with XRE-family HTH domain